MMMFYTTGIIGIIVGLAVAPPSITVMITFMGLINVGLGAFFTFIFLTQVQKDPDKRKKKRKSD